MGYMSYNRVGYARATRGFRLNHRRSSVLRQRARFSCFFKFLSRWWRCSFMRRSSTKRGGGTTSSTSGLVREKLQNKPARRVDYGRLRSFGRSNSFYAEAIADCLEFIKRSSVSLEQK